MGTLRHLDKRVEIHSMDRFYFLNANVYLSTAFYTSSLLPPQIIKSAFEGIANRHFKYIFECIHQIIFGCIHQIILWPVVPSHSIILLGINQHHDGIDNIDNSIVIDFDVEVVGDVRLDLVDNIDDDDINIILGAAACLDV